MTGSSARLEVDAGRLAIYVALIAVLTVVVVLPLARFILRPYSSTARALNGPPIKHWFAGSWDADTYTNGRIVQEMQRNIDEFGPVCSLTTLGRKTSFIVGDHKAANHVFLQKPYARSKLRVNILRRFVGRGLLTEEGATHRRQRKIANPAFTVNAVFDMAPIVREKVGTFMKRLQEYTTADMDPSKTKYGTRIDISGDFQRVTLDIIGKAGFGYEFDSLVKMGGHVSELHKAMIMSRDLNSTRTLYATARLVFDKPVTFLGRLFRVKEQVILDKAQKILEDVCQDLVDRAKAEAESSGTHSSRDVLSLMVRANVSPDVKPSQRMSSKELISTVPVLLLAGHETTAATLSFAVHEFTKSEHGKKVQERIRSELSESPGWDEDASMLDSLPYLDAVVREMLRQAPPIRRMSREAPYDDVIPLANPITLRDGTKTDRIRVSKGQGIELPVLYMNTCEQFWGSDGREFKPERWLSEDHEWYTGESYMDPAVKELRGVWSHLLTFGAGPQQCIGLRLAILELKFVLANLLTTFQLLPPTLPGEEPIKMSYLTPIAAFPVIVGKEKEGHTMPVRLLPLQTNA
ncbi:hypothetical protein OC846_006364 [Tilletia horrida]|uniref:Cytochrome P450 n=1 Tax=Tilletia horrida TaxID=155126 RepID=A0AAN6GIZ4_9BASI|nr:hypothetical protein OC846_006364 [Tilletia horrida]